MISGGDASPGAFTDHESPITSSTAVDAAGRAPKLYAMPRLRITPRPALVLAFVVGAGCERTKPAPGNDTAAAAPPPRESASSATDAAAAWDPSAGPALAVAGATPAEAILVIPDYGDDISLDTVRYELGALRDARFDLFARGRLVGEARLDVIPARPAGECSAWPTARVTTQAGSPSAWTVGFAAGRARAIPVDSIEGLARVDSARLPDDVARLV